MTAYVALLRAVNVGGTGKLPMAELVRICETMCFTGVRTYIASGNTVFASQTAEARVKAQLEQAVHAHAGKPIGVLVRNASEMAEVLENNPFFDEARNRTLAIFLDEAPPSDTLSTLSGQKDEVVRLGRREIYVRYGDGMGTSTLKVPAATKIGTARNMNTVAKLAAMAAEI